MVEPEQIVVNAAAQSNKNQPQTTPYKDSELAKDIASKLPQQPINALTPVINKVMGYGSGSLAQSTSSAASPTPAAQPSSQVEVPKPVAPIKPIAQTQQVLGNIAGLYNPSVVSPNAQVYRNIGAALQAKQDIYNVQGKLVSVPRGTVPTVTIQAPSASVETPTPVVPPTASPTFIQRFQQATQGKMLGGVIPSVSGTINFLGSELGTVASKIPFEQIPLAFTSRNAVGYYNEYGQFTPFPKPINIENIPQIKQSIEQQREVAAKKTQETASYFFTGLPYMVGGGASAALLGLTGAENIFTPAGQKSVQQQASQIGPIAYAIPYAELGLGAVGAFQGLRNVQIQEAMSANPKLQESIIYPPNEKGQILMAQRYIQTNQPVGTASFFPKAQISTVSTARLTPVEDFYQISSAEALTKVRVPNYLTGGLKTIQTIPTTFFGDINPSEAAYVSKFGGLKITKELPNAYTGKIMMTTLDQNPKSVGTVFGGLPIKTEGETSLIASGEIAKVRISPEGQILGKLTPDILGIVRPVKEGSIFIPLSEKGGQLLPTTVEQPLIVNPVNTFEKVDILQGLIGKAAVESANKFITPVVNYPLFKLGVPVASTQFSLPAATQTNLLATTPINVTKQINLLGTAQIQPTSQVETQVQIPQQIQLQPQIQKQVQIQEQGFKFGQNNITPTIPPIFPVPSIPIIKEKKNKLGLSKRQAYNVLYKRRGKFLEYKKNLPLGRALQAGAEVTTRTLARTFKLIPSGTTESLDISYFPSSRIFRPPKNKIPLTFVQRVALTRGTGEISEILAAKRSAKMLKPKKTRRFKLI